MTHTLNNGFQNNSICINTTMVSICGLKAYHRYQVFQRLATIYNLRETAIHKLPSSTLKTKKRSSRFSVRYKNCSGHQRLQISNESFPISGVLHGTANIALVFCIINMKQRSPRQKEKGKAHQRVERCHPDI